MKFFEGILDNFIDNFFIVGASSDNERVGSEPL